MSFRDVAAMLIFPVLVAGYLRFERALELHKVVIISIMFCLIYVPPTVIFLRRAKLSGFLRYLFGLTVVPLFLIFFYHAIIYSFNLEGFGEQFGAARNASPTNRGGSVLALPLVLLSAALCWIWYRLLRVIQGFLHPDEA
jgi:hypothetical protein